MKHNMAAYEWEDEDWPNETSYNAYLERCMRYQGNLQPFKKYKSAWAILDRHYEHCALSCKSIMNNDATTWKNLQLLCGEQGDISNYLVNKIDRTSTALGQVTLRTWIASPTDNVSELLARQERIRLLLEDTQLFEELEKLLIIFKESENFLLSFWMNDPLKQAAENHHFKLSALKPVENYINNTPPFLTLLSCLNHQTRILSCLSATVAVIVLPMYALMHAAQQSVPAPLNTLAQRLVGSSGALYSLMSCLQDPIIQNSAFLSAGIYCALRTPDEYEWMWSNFRLTMHLHTKLYHTARCLKSIKKIGEILNYYAAFNIEEKSIPALLQSISTDAQKMLGALQDPLFNHEGTLLDNWGKVLVTYQLIHDHTAALEPLLCALGEIDAYMSCARLYKEFEHQRVCYTFAEYDVTSKQPFISADKIWSPFIDPSHVVANSITLGTDHIPHNLIITGPNEGGKSTFVKSLALAIILAQSIGIAPAKDIRLTPFSYVATYLNIVDDSGKSLFEAQLQRSRSICDHIFQMGADQYSFVIIDELFNGTDPRVGQVISYSFADYLRKNRKVISIFPTHFPLLTDLEKTGDSINYKVSAIIDQQGKITYPFLVEKGISEQNIVLDIMRNEGFTSAIISQATELLCDTR